MNVIIEHAVRTKLHIYVFINMKIHTVVLDFDIKVYLPVIRVA